MIEQFMKFLRNSYPFKSDEWILQKMEAFVMDDLERTGIQKHLSDVAYEVLSDVAYEVELLPLIYDVHGIIYNELPEDDEILPLKSEESKKNLKSVSEFCKGVPGYKHLDWILDVPKEIPGDDEVLPLHDRVFPLLEETEEDQEGGMFAGITKTEVRKDEWTEIHTHSFFQFSLGRIVRIECPNWWVFQQNGLLPENLCGEDFDVEWEIVGAILREPWPWVYTLYNAELKKTIDIQQEFLKIILN